jgi:hypothetical protein
MLSLKKKILNCVVIYYSYSILEMVQKDVPKEQLGSHFSNYSSLKAKNSVWSKMCPYPIPSAVSLCIMRYTGGCLASCSVQSTDLSPHSSLLAQDL